MKEINIICRDLGLPKGDKFTQNWVYELPEKYRTKGWLDKYITAYLSGVYSLEVKKILMALSLDVANDLLSSGESPKDDTIQIALNALLNDHQHHFDLIDYWSLENEPLEGCFALTPDIRKIKGNVNN